MNINSVYNKLKLVKEYGRADLIDEILKELEIEIITNGKVDKSIISAYKRLVRMTADRPKFSKIYNSNGNYCLCDGYKLIDYGKNINNIPKELQVYISENTEEMNGLNFDNIKNNTTTIAETLDIKELEKVKKYNKVNKKLITYRIGNKHFDVNLILDLAILSGLKETKITIENDFEEISPINIIFNDEIKGLVLPIKKEDWSENDKILDEILKIGEEK